MGFINLQGHKNTIDEEDGWEHESTIWYVRLGHDVTGIGVISEHERLHC